MAKDKMYTSELIKNDPRFVNAEMGKVTGGLADGKMVVEDLGNGLVVVNGPQGDVSVLPLEGVDLQNDAVLRQKAIDKAIELGVTDEKSDPRHSEHHDFQSADGTYVNRDKQDSNDNSAIQKDASTVE